ncbi:MAG TPA: tetratricopeptide repeat protein [Rubrobacter sp.]|nr:tetratricopeptide repeat protein [Rubrobacter sp.]
MDTGTGLAFGDLLRRWRASAGFTQEELAESTGLTTQAISLLERGERRRPQRYTVLKLSEALGLEGVSLAEFEAAARPSARGRTALLPRGTLPTPQTPLVGREDETAEVAGLVARADVRLLTVTGPGGVGKTRLALEVASLSRGAFANGTAFVSLAPLRDASVVLSTLAEAFGVREVAGQSLLQTVGLHLGDRRVLLVLDNLEHLPAAVPLVSDLLASCPGLTVLATSRAPLHLTGERQFPLGPLPSLAEEHGTPAAVELFRQRAVAVAPHFELTDANAATMARVCQRLDGLPLAIELAAARVKLFTPLALLERLDRGLELLAGGPRDLPERQRTLRDTVAWSYDLLDEQERLLFRRLSVFVGDFSLEAAEAVCWPGAEGDFLQTLASLVDNSLLVSRAETAADGGQEPRFGMLGTIREYALGRLESDGEAGETYHSHALYYLALAESTSPETAAPAQREWWWRRLEEEHDNLRTALGWAVRTRESDTAARFALALWRFWSARHLGEGFRWLEAVLTMAGDAPGVEPQRQERRRAFLLLVAGILATRHGDYDRAVALDEASLTLYRDLGHERSTHGPLRELGAVAYHRGDYDRAVHLGEQALAVARESGNASGSALAACNLADALRARGDLEAARTLLEEAQSSLGGREQTVPGINALVNTLNRLGSIRCETGDYGLAGESYVESLRLMWQHVGRAYETAACLEGLARVAAMQGRPERAAWLLGVSSALRDEMGTPLTPITSADHDHASEAALEALGEQAFETAWTAGNETPFEAAIVAALEE